MPEIFRADEAAVSHHRTRERERLVSEDRMGCAFPGSACATVGGMSWRREFPDGQIRCTLYYTACEHHRPLEAGDA